ncbi:MAG TPA: HAMP domain-containing sensor histidine kinase [Pseudobdellovibrionaceae bacterium]|nr:HAMP domain-containing sensor histidine kinase [Pseudobdellovibrionaceae bacterium]
MTKLGRSPFLTIWFYITFCTFATWQEYYTPISPEDFKVLVILRILILGSAIPVAFVLRKNPFSVWANGFICMNFLGYSMVGHYYRPLYYACFLQTLYAFSFLFFTSRRLHFILTSLKSLGFIAFYLLTYELVKYPQGSETKDDFVMTIVMAWGLGLLVHHLFTAERGLKESAHDRFSLLGRHASGIVHDIKGSIGIPHLYLDEARRSLEREDYPQAREYLEKMEKSLSRTEKIVFDLNQLSRLAEGDGAPFKISEAVRDVLDMLAKRLHDVEVAVDGDFEVRGDRGIVCSVFLNLILNSVQSFKRSGTESPKIGIQIDSESRLIAVVNNGAGFSREVLSSLAGGGLMPSAVSNSGLGLYLVRENLRALKGRIAFQNIDGGAKVEIRLSQA